MKITEVILEAASPKAGREFQHLEDLVYIEGPAGLDRALERISHIRDNSQHMEVKWDGSPAIVFGRDDAGVFHFGDKYSKEMMSSPEAVYSQYIGRQAEPDDARKAFAQGMSDLHAYYERATPKNFRGFIEAGLLYKTTPPLNNNTEYVIDPNTVIYYVDATSELGQRIGLSSTGAAATAYFDQLPALGGQRAPVGDKYKAIQSEEVVIVAPKFVAAQAKLDDTKINTIQDYIRLQRNAINDFIAPVDKMADWPNIIYNYVNTQVDQPGALNTLGNNFAEWIDNSALSGPKKERALAKIQQNPDGYQAMFVTIRAIMHIKDDIIDQLEHPTLQSLGIRAELKGGFGAGGEGFVSDPNAGVGPIKMVKRAGFSAANRAMNRGGKA
jgi:hypothetical protein